MEVQSRDPWTRVCLTVGQLGLLSHPAIIFPGLECIVRLDILSGWLFSMAYEPMAIKVRIAKWKSLELSLSRKLVSQKQSWRSYRDYGHHKGLEGCKVVIPTTSPFSSFNSFWPVQKTDGHVKQQ